MSRLKLVNEQNTDLSIEAYCLMGSALYNIAAAEIIMEQISSALDKLFAEGTWFQEKKKHIKEARKNCEGLLLHLYYATGEVNERIYKHAADTGRSKWASDTLRDSYQIAALLSIMYFTKGEGDEKISRNMLKALGNFKVKEPHMDIEAILDFFHYNKFISEQQ